MQLGQATAARLVALTDASDAAAQNNLGVLLQRGGHVADAERAFGRAVALDGGMTVARRNLRALPASAADTTAASRWANVRSDAANHDAWRALVRHHTARGEFDVAREVLDRWDTEATSPVLAAIERARWALEAGLPDVACVAVSRARETAGAHALAGDVALFALLDLLDARAAYQQGDAARALAAVERVRSIAPDDAEAELLRSFVLGELGSTSAAAASRRRASELDPALARADAALSLVEHQDDDSVVDARAMRPNAGRDTGRPSTAHIVATATALRHKGYYDEAVRALAARVEETAPHDRALVLAALGAIHLQRGAAADAVPVLEAARDALSDAREDTGRVRLSLGVARLLTGSADAADAIARELVHEASPASVRAGGSALRAIIAWRRGDLSGARAFLLDAAAHARGLDDVIRSTLAADLALLLAEAGGGSAAVAAGAAAVRLAPGDAAAHVAHARALARVGDHAAAQAAFARACVLAPTDAAARYGLAFAAGACGDRTTARTELVRATALSPVVRGPAPRLVIEADGLIVVAADGSGVRVPTASEAAAVLDEDRPRVAAPAHDYAHVDARLAAGEYDRALAAADAALARGAPLAEGLVRAGHALARSGRVALALDRYERAAAAAPTDPGFELHVVRALHRLGRLAAACERASAALVRWPTDPSFAALLARAAADRGAVDDAAQALERCARVRRETIGDADPAAFWADVACAWQALGAWEAAADAWTEAAQAVPAVPTPTLARARALARAGQADVAEALLSQLAETAPELPDLWRARAEVAIASGQLSAARAYLARVVGRDARDVDALASLASTCVDAARLPDARSAATQALALDADHPLALAVLGDCHAADDDVPAALDAWRRSLAASPVGAGAARARAGLRTFAASSARS